MKGRKCVLINRQEIGSRLLFESELSVSLTQCSTPARYSFLFPFRMTKLFSPSPLDTAKVGCVELVCLLVALGHIA